MTVLITNWMLSGRSGTETHVRDLARGLKARGHQPAVFTFSAGDLARELTEQGIPVVTRLEDLPWKPDVVHGHHNFVTVCALLGLPKTRGLFVCHDARAWHDEAPAFPRLLKYAAVDEYCRERVARERNCAAEEVLCIGNSVDLTRFQSRGPLPATPGRALVFSNLAAEHTFLPVLREACRMRGIPLDVVGGGVGNTVTEPEKILGQYDLVFGKARCAMEALATGCATILCGPEGMGPIVTPESFDHLRRNNFGRRCLTQAMEVQSVLAAIDAYPGTDHRAVHEMARRVLGVEEMVDRWLHVYESLIAEPCPDAQAAEMRAAADLLESLSPRLFSLYKLESENAALRHASESLKRALGGSGIALEHGRDRIQQGVHHGEEYRLLKREVARLRDERDRAKDALRRAQEKNRSRFRIAGLLGSCWKSPLLRPLATLLGVRPGAAQAMPAPSQSDRVKGDAAAPIPVLIGVPRSGTTLLRMMLDAHPDLAIPPETGFLMQCTRWITEREMSREAFVEAIANHPPEAPHWNDFGIDREKFLETLRARKDRFRPVEGLRCFFELYAQRFGKKRWGEKTPENVFHVREIHRAFPDARFVHIVRDPRDVVLSWRATWFAPSKDPAVLAAEWARRVLFAREQMAAVPFAMEIRYEDLVQHTEPTLRRVCEFLQLDFHPMMLQHHLRSGDRLKEHGARSAKDGTVLVSQEQRLEQQHMVLKAPDAKRVGAWKNTMTKEERLAVEKAVGPLLEECGYGPRLEGDDSLGRRVTK